MLLWGIWQGKGKPPFNSFFDPFTSEMSELYNEGKCCNVNNFLVTFLLCLVLQCSLFKLNVQL